MNKQKFDQIVTSIFADCEDILQTAGDEYAGDEDRLANFNKLAQDLKIPATQIAFIYFKKHVDGIARYITNGKAQRDSFNGRIIDAINYLVLISVLAEDKALEKTSNE